MSKREHDSPPIYSPSPTEIEGFDSLAELALVLRWSWSHATDNVWRKFDSILLATAPDRTVAVGALMDWIEEGSGRDALAAVGHRVANERVKSAAVSLVLWRHSDGRGMEVAMTVCDVLGLWLKTSKNETQRTKGLRSCYTEPKH